jgi:hypothetical protein
MEKRRAVSDLNDRLIFVLKTGITWGDLPQALGYDGGMSCWRRILDWQWAGI